jgi:AraC family transcriptional regulator of arabinose operon
LRYHAEEPLRCSRVSHRPLGWLPGRTPQCAWVLLTHGHAEIRYDDQPGQWRLEPGDCLQRFPERPHAIRFESGAAAWSLAMPAEALQALAACGLRQPVAPLLHVGLDPSLLRRFARLAERLGARAAQRRWQLLPEVVALAGDLLQRHRSRGGEDDPWERACDRLASELHRPLDLRRVAADLGLAYNTFRLGFKLRLGQPPGHWRTLRRIERARELLRQGLEVQACAESLGYCDAFAFSRQFKQHAGLSPSRWRAEAW